MGNMIFHPLEDYEKTLKNKHLQQTTRFFDRLVAQSGVNIAENRATVKKMNELREKLSKLKRKRNWLRVLRVVLCITILLIPLVIYKLTPVIRELKEDIDEADKKADELMQEALRQMLPLNNLFTSWDCIQLLEETLPALHFETQLSVEQERDMRNNYDLDEIDESEISTLDILAGRYNGNPLLFERRLVHEMGMETYHGSTTISWTEWERNSEGELERVTHTETLHASVTKPKPFYHEETVLHYGAQGGPELSFTRDASHLDQKSERQIERYVKKGSKKLQRLNEKAIKIGDDFMSMSNEEFEVLFDALDRTNEVQYRTLFTPLAQTNMVDLLLSKSGYGDDFAFIKRKRMNTIVSKHSQERPLLLLSGQYVSYSFDIIKENFIQGNTEFFKGVYFDLAPILAVPMYQESPVHSLDPIKDSPQLYAEREYEVLANLLDESLLVHPDTQTKSILKSKYTKSAQGADEARITAYSYDTISRVDVVSVYGGDGHYHDVDVYWDEYIPLEEENVFRIGAQNIAQNMTTLANKHGLCIYQ